MSFKKHYLDTMNYDKQKEGELNEEEFVKFWADFYALFDKIDKDGGFYYNILSIKQKTLRLSSKRSRRI